MCYIISTMSGRIWKGVLGGLAGGVLLLGAIYFVGTLNIRSVSYTSKQNANASDSPEVVSETEKEVDSSWPLVLDTKEYDKRLLELSDYTPPKPVTVVTHGTVSSSATTTIVVPPSPLVYSSTTNVTVIGKRWPAPAPYSQGGAILPFQRIVAYYGNFFSRQMGVLGQYDPEDMLQRLAKTSKEWEVADPRTPVLPAIEYIAMVAQGGEGADGMYRAVMPDAEIEKAYTLAHETHGILILDLQVGLSSIENELPKFKKYLMRPDVHLALDPEFSMKNGKRPGTSIGTFNARDINYVINYLATIVRENKFPPKVLLVHRFTQDMVTGVSQITPKPEVQFIMVMDGWGSKDLKRGTYAGVIEPEPVQFTGVKLFYKNDLKPPSTGMLTPAEVLSLHPKPIYIQYQ